jgi:hypothetical protein
VIDDVFFSFAARLEMRRRDGQKQASERFRRRAFGPQIDEKGGFSGVSLAHPYVATADFGLRMRFKTTDL